MNSAEESRKDADQVVMDIKIAGIIKAYSRKYNVSLEEAAHDFYSSKLSGLIEDRVADLHCRSDLYLAEEIRNELHKP